MAVHTPPHLRVAASTLNRILTGASGISPERALRLSEDLALISAKTFEHYDERAVEFREGTRDHDVKRNIEALPRVLSEWRAFLETAGFAEPEYYFRPPWLPPERQPWLASVWRRSAAIHKRGAA